MIETTKHHMTLDQFEHRLLDGDRWVELVDGQFLQLNPPDDAHGNVVRNLARALASHFRKSSDTYACFELPLIVERDPATVRCPAVSCFQFEREGRFVETDKVVTETRPVLIIEVASTNERREAISSRVTAYLHWGVTSVWVIDPVARHVHQFHAQGKGQIVKEPQVLSGHPILAGFSIPVTELFRPPAWLAPKSNVTGELR